jgi:hypothetical protein
MTYWSGRVVIVDSLIISLMAQTSLWSFESQSKQSSENEPGETLENQYVLRYVNLLDKAKWFVIMFWFLAVAGCIYPVMLLFPATRLFFEPPKGSETWRANVQLQKYFPQYVSEAVCVVLFQDQYENITSNYTQNLVETINNTLSAKGYDNLIGD